ncbi:MAG: hypothetical protein R2941_03755 [Desulfobacterales bacterium]
MVYLDKMGRASALADRALALCRKTPEISLEIQKELEKIRELVRRQEEKRKTTVLKWLCWGLKKREKYAYLNAWLGIEILSRQWMNAVLILPVNSGQSFPEKEQEYVIEYYPPEEFKNSLRKKRRLIQELPKGFLNAAIWKKMFRKLNPVWTDPGCSQQGRNQRRFDDVSEVREDLKQAIDTTRHMPAPSKGIVLKTVKLRADRDIVFP